MSFGAFFSAILLLLVVFGLCYLSFRLGYCSADRKNIVQNYQYTEQPHAYTQAEYIPCYAPEYVPCPYPDPLPEKKDPVDDAFMQRLSNEGHAIIRFSGRNAM